MQLLTGRRLALVSVRHPSLGWSSRVCWALRGLRSKEKGALRWARWTGSPHHRTGSSALSVALESGREQLRAIELNLAKQVPCFIRGPSFRDDRPTRCTHLEMLAYSSPWCLSFTGVVHSCECHERHLADPYPSPFKENHKQIANIMQRRPDWLGRLLVPLLVINIAGVCKRTLTSRCLVLINSSYELLGSSVAVHGEHPAWIAVGVCTPGLPLVSVDSKQHISLLFPIGSAPLLHECWCFPHDWGGRKWLYFIHTVFCTQP